MEKDITAFDTSYQDFFTKASRSHVIPTLQRPYTWTKTEVSQLWNDLIESDSPYYIGSIVIIGAPSSAERDEVIDGQQRLTTISLMLIAIRNSILNKKGLDDVKKDIQWLLSEPVHGAPPILRLCFANENSNELYSSLVSQESKLPRTKGQDAFINNLELLIDEVRKSGLVNKPSDVRALVNRIKNIQIVYIRCSDRSAAYKLFESINARSISFASTDLIKNRILYLAHQTNKETLKDTEKKWREMELTFNEDAMRLKTFIRHHWISLGRYTSHAKLFRDFEAYLKKKKGTALRYLDDLASAAKIYVSLRSAGIDGLEKLPKVRYEREEIRKGLEFLSFLGVDQVYSVLLYLYAKEPKSFKKDLNKLIAFQFIYKYVPGSPSEPEKKYFAALPADAITKQNMFQGLTKLVQGKREDFSTKLIESLKYTEGKSGDVQFALEKYLYSRGGPKAFRQATVEHIISQSFTAADANKLGISKKRMNELVHSLGNLTVLEKVENGVDYSDKPFNEKVVLYKKDLYKANREIAKYAFDTDPLMATDKRAKALAGSIYDIFFFALEKGKWPELT